MYANLGDGDELRTAVLFGDLVCVAHTVLNALVLLGLRGKQKRCTKKKALEEGMNR